MFFDGNPRLSQTKFLNPMATSTTNVLTRGYHGRIGTLVFRRWGQKTVVSAVADYTGRTWSKAQKSNRDRFRDAMDYARKAMNDPEQMNLYRKKAKGKQTLWNVAVSDYMLKPRMNEMLVMDKHGRKRNTSRNEAKDKAGVKGVIVSIVNSRGFEVEGGIADQMPYTGHWVYNPEGNNPLWKGIKIVVKATDPPGNGV
jgi:hypothetical protein